MTTAAIPRGWPGGEGGAQRLAVCQLHRGAGRGRHRAGQCQWQAGAQRGHQSVALCLQAEGNRRQYDGDGLGAGLALFSTDKPRAAYDANNNFTASGKDRHQGVELTVFGEASKRVRVLGGLTWLDAKQRATGNAAIDGNRVIGVPRFQANLGAEWDIPGVQGLTLDGRVVYTGASYADDANTLKVPGWTRLDAGLRYMMDVDGHVVTLRARVENIANRNYWSSVGGYPGNGYLVLGGPRTFMLSASMDF